MSRRAKFDARPHGQALRRAYTLMRARFGHQHWWPGETPFEICVGAILTQNTNWGNVERAIASLKAARVLEPKKLFALSEKRLAELIRPAGYFNVKARRLRSFLRVLVNECDGNLDHLFAGETPAVRERLLAINGIGPETADSMLLYAGRHPSFVVDAYTKRIFQRHGWGEEQVRTPKADCRSPKGASACSELAVQRSRPEVRSPEVGKLDYDELKTHCERVLSQKPQVERLDYWQDYHAQLVMVGKHFCRPRNPLCDTCPLKRLLPPTATMFAK